MIRIKFRLSRINKGEVFVVLPHPQLMNNKKVFLTKEGLDELRAEHADLTQVKRPQVVQRVSDAREMGDLAENAEYSAAREELAFIDGRIDELVELLKQVEVISEDNNSKNQVILGSKVTVNHNGNQTVYNVVGEWEADPTEKKISHESPLGKALLGKKVGEKVEVTAPVGNITYTILEIN